MNMKVGKTIGWLYIVILVLLIVWGFSRNMRHELPALHCPEPKGCVAIPQEPYER